MIVFDTDHVSVLMFAGPERERILSRIAASDDRDLAMTIVTAEEQMRGWLAQIRRKRVIFDQLRAYEELSNLITFWAEWRIVPLDRLAANEFDLLRRQRLRVGTQDLKIGAIALANRAVLVSSNTLDFAQIPNLQVEDWRH
jgi:tRNA(fMet)-specific endonuclease VapC